MCHSNNPHGFTFSLYRESEKNLWNNKERNRLSFILKRKEKKKKLKYVLLCHGDKTKKKKERKLFLERMSGIRVI